MLDEVFDKYKDNFKHFIIFFILSIVIAFIIKNSGIITFQSTDLNIDNNLEEILSVKNIITILVFILVEIYITTYGLILAKKAIKEEPVHMVESFTDTFSYYPRVLGLNLIFIILIIAINLLLGKLISITTSYGFLMFHFILYFFIIILFWIFTQTIQNYLVYYDGNIGHSIRGGISVGKSYFFKMLGLSIVSSLIGNLPKMESAENSWIVYVIGILIVNMYNMFMNLYIINLCKIEE